MRDQTKWGRLLKMLRAASGLSQEDIALQFSRDQAFASRVEAAKTVITPETIAQWVGICGGKRLIDSVIQQLQALRRMIDVMDFDPVLLQA